MSANTESKQPWWKSEIILDGPLPPHEPLAFMRRRGACYVDIAEVYDHQYSEAEAKRLAECGHTFIEICFFKGIGLEAEKLEMERTKRFIKYLQKYGVRAGVYTQWGSLFTETFFREIPEARSWVQIGVDGKPIEYDNPIAQYYRWRGCPGNPDFIAFLKRVSKLAVEEFGVDVVYFDNMCLFENHDTLCYCEHCQKGLREHVAAKYPDPKTLWERMGLWSAEHIKCPPLYPWSNHTEQANPITDPLVQEFIEFRCKQFADAWHDMREYIATLSADVTMMGNPSFPRKYNEQLTSAIDFWLLKDTDAFYYMENAVRDVGIRHDAVVSNIRGYRYGRALGVRFIPCGGEQEPGLTYCEGLAFNDGHGHLREAFAPFKAFFEANREAYWQNVEPATSVAVLRHDRSLTLRWHEAFTSMEMAQQQLMCAGIPWMPLWAQQMFDGTLEKYKLLVVPGCSCLSAEEIDRIVAFAEAGGVVVLCDAVAMFDEHHMLLRTWPLAKLFGDVDPAGFAINYAGRKQFFPSFENQELGPLTAKVGKGEVVYLPRIRQSSEPVKTYEEIGGYDGFQHLQLPAHWRDLPDTVQRLAPGGLPVKVDGPETVMVEALRKTDGSRTMIHLVNYATDAVPAGIEVHIDGAKSASLFIPDISHDAQPLETTTADGVLTVRLPGFTRYAIIVVE